MKRLILLIFVVMLAYWVLARHSSTLGPPAGTVHRNSRLLVHDHDATRHFVTQTGQGGERTINDVGHAVHQAVGEAGERLKHKFDEFCDEFCDACLGDDDDVAVAQSERAHARSSVVEREDADGIPVPIVPGTRVTEAQPVPPVPPRKAVKARRAAAAARPEPPKVVVKIASPENFAAEIPALAGPISATPERADAAARKQLREEIIAWLEPDVPSTWTLPGRELDQLVIQSNLESVARESDPDLMYITHLTLDTTPARRERLVKLYNRELVGRRLVKLGGGLGFILMCLAAVSGYIRADEASKGYYTNRLRLLAAAGIGAGGVLIYQMIA